jgi:hypothetical protein
MSTSENTVSDDQTVQPDEQTSGYSGKRKISKDEQQDRKRGRIGSNNTDTQTQDPDSCSDSNSDAEDDENMTEQKEKEAEFISMMLAALKNENIAKLLHSKTDDLLEQMGKKIIVMENTIKETNVEVEDLKVKIDEYEQRDRNAQIVVAGMGAELMSTEGVITLLNEKLGTHINGDDIEYTMKMGPRDKAATRMKVVFKEVALKQQFTKLKAKLKKNNLWISDVLTPHRMNLAYLARKAVRENKVNQTWVYDGKVFTKTTAEAKPKRINTASDIPT